jgi:hypothetical protein
MFCIATSSDEQHGCVERRTLPAPVRSSPRALDEKGVRKAENGFKRGTKKIFSDA